jgi:hypothetical protein
MNAQPSDNTLGDNIDVFLPKSDFPKGSPPSKRDMVFFTNEMRFYSVSKVLDAGDFYIVEVEKYKEKD